MSAPTVFRVGDTFAYLGPINQVGADGVESPFDFTGWGIAASLVRQGAAGATLPLTGAFVAGVARIEASAAETAAWPTGEYALVIRLTSPAGATISGGNLPFRLTR